MNYGVGRRSYRASTVAIFVVSAAFLASCAAQQPKSMMSTKRSKEYFSEAAYGVKASPRVTTKQSRLPRGGGREQIGKPYKVRGKWYYPKEDPDYRQVGAASWYGDAFHGRLTANGEIYDMTHLTAAHPTMPLPSYARVTNLKSGSSVVVRVNDRGPYAPGRIIDLSKRAAELLDYAHGGTANVTVEYVGRAPIDGRDDQFLLASYRPGRGAPDPSDGLPAGVMIAMNGPTPSADTRAVPFSDALTDATPAMAASGTVPSGGEIRLPAFGPVAPERPFEGMTAPGTQVAFAVTSYSEEPVSKASAAFAALERKSMTSEDIVASWKRRNPGGPTLMAEPYVAAGTFASEREAMSVARALSSRGRVVLEKSATEGFDWFSVSVYRDGRADLDELLKTAWRGGAPEAITVRE